MVLLSWCHCVDYFCMDNISTESLLNVVLQKCNSGFDVSAMKNAAHQQTASAEVTPVPPNKVSGLKASPGRILWRNKSVSGNFIAVWQFYCSTISAEERIYFHHCVIKFPWGHIYVDDIYTTVHVQSGVTILTYDNFSEGRLLCDTGKLMPVNT